MNLIETYSGWWYVGISLRVYAVHVEAVCYMAISSFVKCNCTRRSEGGEEGRAGRVKERERADRQMKREGLE